MDDFKGFPWELATGGILLGCQTKSPPTYFEINDVMLKNELPLAFCTAFFAIYFKT